MASVNLPDEVCDRLKQRAAALNVSIEQLITQMLDLMPASGSGPAAPLQPVASFDEWKKKFDAWMADVQARANRYPPGFVMDDSRESMYEGCGE